jgi:hypothetical protein
MCTWLTSAKALWRGTKIKSHKKIKKSQLSNEASIGQRVPPFAPTRRSRAAFGCRNNSGIQRAGRARAFRV